MTEVIGIRFKSVGKVYYFDPRNIKFNTGDHVIVETARGIECGEVVMCNHMVDDDKIIKPLKSVIRAATDEDMAHVADNSRKEKEAFRICLKKIAEHKLEMKLIGVEYTFDNNKILFTLAESVKTVVSELTTIKSDVKEMRVEIDCVKIQPITKKAAITDKLVGILLGVFGTGIVVFVLSNMFPNIFK